MPFLDSFFADAEYGRNLVHGQLLEMAKHEHFAVSLGKPRKSAAEPITKLSPLYLTAWAGPGGNEPARQVRHGLVREFHIPAGLARHTSGVCKQVAEVQVHESVPRNLPQPWVEGQRPLPGVAWQLAGGFYQRILHDVGSTDAG